MRLINLTPHAIVVGGVTIEPSGEVARCREILEPRGSVVLVDAVPLVAKRFGELEGLPSPEPETLYIVSALAAQAAWAAGRRDVVCPSDLIRDAQGRVIGAASLCVAPD